MGGRRGKDFCMALAELGEPDQEFAEWTDHLRLFGGGCPAGFAKWTVQEAAGERLHWCQRDGVEVHFTGKLLDGTVFASTRQRSTPIMVTPAEDDVMHGFTLAISSMQPGEKAVFTVPADFALTKAGCPASIPWNVPPDQTLRFDIELISVTTDILDNQGILKKIMKVGETLEQPDDFDEVFVNYNACLKDGTSVSKSEEVKFSVAEGFFCPAFAHAVKTMARGEEAVLIVKPEYGFGEQGRPSIGNEAAVPPDATLYVNLELMSWISVSHVGEDRGILKKTTHRSIVCKKPHNQSVVQVRLIGKLQDGTVFDRRGHDGEEPFEFTIDEEHVIYGLDEAVMTMNEGEVASFTIPPRYAFGVAGSNQYQLAVIPPDSVVIYEMELLSIVDVEEHDSWPWEMTSSEEQIEAAKVKEREGDDLFNSGKYLRAYRRYLRARQILPACFMTVDEIMEIPNTHHIKEMLISLSLKNAECAIQLQRYEQALNRYREVLKYDPVNAKALQMVAQTMPQTSVAIDEHAMNRNLEFFRDGGMVGVGMKKREKDDHQPSGRPVIIPHVATPELNARQPPASTAPAVDTAHQSPAAPASSTTSADENQSSDTTRNRKGRLASCFGFPSSRVN